MRFLILALVEKMSRAPWQLTSVMLVWLTTLLTGVVLVGEAILAGIWLLWGGHAGLGLLVGLTATLLPYMLLICLAAQMTATLQALGHFSTPALTPTLLNVCWLTGVWAIAPCFAPDGQAQAYVVAISILVAGVLQLGVQVPALRRAGFRFDYNWAAASAGMARIGRTIAPMLFGLAVTQINTFTDSIIAWGLAALPGGPQRIPWLHGALRYPLQQGGGRSHLYWRTPVSVPAGHHWVGRGRLDLPPAQPARRTRRPRPAGRRLDAGAAAGAVLERAGRRGAHRAGTSAGQTAVPDRQLHRRRHGRAAG